MTVAFVLGGTPFAVRANSRPSVAGASNDPASSAPAPLATPVSTATATPTPDVPSASATPDGVVPWADLAANPANNPQPLPTATVDPSLPACLADQLTAETDGVGGAMGTNYLPITIHRASGPACVLHDRVVAVSGTTKAGTHLDFPLYRETLFDPSVIPVALVSPSDVGSVRVASASSCPDQLAGHYYPLVHDLLVTLGKTGVLHVTSPFVGFGCSEEGHELAGGDVGIRAPIARYTPLPLEQLTAAVHAPSTATAGRTLHYTVTLTNPTDATIDLSPCPNFTTGIKEAGAFADHALNCAAAHPIHPGDSETFEMQLAVPPQPEPTNARLSWGFSTGNGFVGGNAAMAIQ